MSGQMATARVSAWLSINDFLLVASSNPATHRKFYVYPALPYREVVEGHPSVIVIRGDEADRAAALAEIVTAAQWAYPAAELVRGSNPGYLREAALDLMRIDSYGPTGPRNSYHPKPERIVTVDWPEGRSEIEQYYVDDLRVLLNLGHRHDTAVIFSLPDVHPIPVEIFDDDSVQKVWALGEITYDDETGFPLAELEAGVRAWVNTIAGFREVMAGAPADWVRSWEQGWTAR